MSGVRFASSVFVALVVALVVDGCALTSKSDSVILRYFTPERLVARSAAAAAQSANLQLRLGRVNSAAYLKDRIAYRDSDYEVGYYDDLRWTEKPESYLRRAAVRALFEEQPIRQIISGPAPILDIELSAFEELRAPRHAARVEMTWTLRDDETVLLQRTLLVESAVEAGASGRSEAAGSRVALAVAKALEESVKTMVSGVVAELTRASASARAPARP